MMSFKQRVARNVAQIRQMNGLDQIELASKIGKSKSYVNKLEFGTLNFTAQMIDDIASALGVGIDDILRNPEERGA